MRILAATIVIAFSTLHTRGSIVDYGVDVQRGVHADPNHWSVYDDFVALGTVSNATLFDDTQSPDPLLFTMPVFSEANAALFVDSNGFVSLVPYAMCSSYCNPGAGGGYAVSANSSYWPLVGLFVMDLNPTHTNASAIYKRINSDKYPNVTIAQVEYRNVVQYTQPDGASTVPVTAQVELWPNGTIVMRYRTVPTSVNRYNSNATVGVALGPNQRVAAPVPSGGTGGQPDITGIRFVPVTDPCNAHMACSGCIADARCLWCGSRSSDQCLTATIARDVCASNDIRDGNTSCTRDVFVDPNPPHPQRYYHQHVQHDTSDFPELASSPYAAARRPVNISSYPQALNLTFNLTFFDFPVSPSDAAASHSTTSVYLHNGGYFTVLQALPQCSANNLTCVDHTIAPFLSPGLAMQSDASVTTIVLPTRSGSGRFCPQLHQNALGECPPGFLVEFTGLRRKVPTFPSRIDVHAVVLVSSNDVISVYLRRVGPEPLGLAPLAPAPIVGLTRLSHADPSASLVPQASIAARRLMTFVPLRGCASCGARGTCNSSTSSCDCAASYSGVGCRRCATGFFGPSCFACPTCLNGGRCDDGEAGTGRCVCSGDFSGERCEVACLPSDPHPLTCPTCNLEGGTCLCGRCICHTTRGWAGANCDTWTDPCRPASLYGCQTCLSNPNVICSYCDTPDFRCIAAAQPGVPTNNVSRCNGREMTVAQRAACRQFRYPDFASDDTGFGVLIVIGVIVFLGFIACLGVCAVCFCQGIPTNPLIANAVVGMPPKSRPRRERELVSMSAVGDVSGPVVGVPLKQISLETLSEMQRERGASNAPMP